MTACGQEEYPRTVYDESGGYTIERAGCYEVKSPSIERFAAITYMRRDLDSAHEMVAACSSDELADKDSLIAQCLWVGAIVMYGKVFKYSSARRGFNATAFVNEKLTGEALERHDYVMTLRDKMIAHDDGVGESKELSLYLTEQPPNHPLFIGVGVGNHRVISLGTDIAQGLEPHFRDLAQLFTELEATTRAELLRGFLATRFADVTLLGPSVEKPLKVDINSVLSRGTA